MRKRFHLSTPTRDLCRNLLYGTRWGSAEIEAFHPRLSVEENTTASAPNPGFRRGAIPVPFHEEVL
jgi:hypothetical protein